MRQEPGRSAAISAVLLQAIHEGKAERAPPREGGTVKPRTKPRIVSEFQDGSVFHANCPCGWKAQEGEKKRLSYVITGHMTRCPNLRGLKCA